MILGADGGTVPAGCGKGQERGKMLGMVIKDRVSNTDHRVAAKTYRVAAKRRVCDPRVQTRLEGEAIFGGQTDAMRAKLLYKFLPSLSTGVECFNAISALVQVCEKLSPKRQRF